MNRFRCLVLRAGAPAALAVGLALLAAPTAAQAAAAPHAATAQGVSLTSPTVPTVPGGGGTIDGVDTGWGG